MGSSQSADAEARPAEGGTESTGLSTSTPADIIRRAHELATSHVGTEHVLLALLEVPTVLRSLPNFPLKEVRAEIASLPWIKSPGPAEATAAAGGAGAKSRSAAVDHMVMTAKAIASADPDASVEGSGRAMQTWHLFLAVLRTERGIARYILLEAAPNIVHDLLACVGKDEAFLKEIPKLVMARAEQKAKQRGGGGEEQVFDVFNVGGEVAIDDAAAARAASLEAKPVAPQPAWCRGPTAESNWLVPGLVMTGQVPGGWHGGHAAQEEVDAILAAGCTTFVCLLEFEPEYLSQIEASAGRAHGAVSSGAVSSGGGGGGGGGDGRGVDVVWFPVDDFSVARTERLEALVAELARRVKRGEVLYIHCFSGRGRTGTVAIPLMLALFPEQSVEALSAVVNGAKQHGRTGRTRGGHMPEVPQQVAQVEQGETRWKRGGHRAKTAM